MCGLNCKPFRRAAMAVPRRDTYEIVNYATVLPKTKDPSTRQNNLNNMDIIHINDLY
jgi:hypothetical protein